MSSYPTQKETKLVKRSDSHASGTLLMEQDDIILSIFSFLDFTNLVRVQSVCLHWRWLVVHKSIPLRLGNKKFVTNAELIQGVEKYCCHKAKHANELSSIYGWPIGKWNVSEITKFDFVFDRKIDFNEDIREWDVSHAISMIGMFHGAMSFNQNISSWNTSNVRYMNGMFSNAIVFNQNISSWDTSQVENMSRMFCDASAFNHDISLWNTANVRQMRGMFCHATSFHHDVLSYWNTSNVTDMQDMFQNAAAFHLNKK